MVRNQRGQAIVLIALMLTVLIGMVALAIDGSRAYAVRRDMQAAVDAAALAAADKLQQTGSYSTAEQAATTIFGTNLRLYSAPACSGYGSPGASPWTVTCTYSDGTALTNVARANGPQGSRFTITATRTLSLQFARVLTNGTTPSLGASANGEVNNLRYTPAVGALNQSGCGGTPGSAISINGTGSLAAIGDVVANGTVSVVAGAVSVAGDLYSRCQSPVPGVTNKCYPSGASAPCTYPDVAGATRAGFRLPDPGYPAPVVAGGTQPIPADNPVLSPGIYTSDPNITSNRCYFLTGGVYQWSAGYTQTRGFVSNELKPPDEPVAGGNTTVANPQFWNTNGVRCAGATRITVTGGGGSSVGTWGVEVTSVRSDTYSGVGYARESAPSVCRSFTATSFQTVTLDVSNVPGATSYYIYLASGGCAAQFGWAGSLAVSGSPQNNNVGGCPFASPCSLGTSSLSVLALILPTLPPPNAAAPPGTTGAYPPDPEQAPLSAGLPNENPATGAGAAGDRANENNCKSVGGAYVSCPSSITPGAVAFYAPGSGCMTVGSTADTYVFSGYQYNWLAVNQPSSNACSNSLGAASNSAYIGLVYAPSSSISITSPYAAESAGTGGILGATISFSGALPRIRYMAAYAPVPPASRLIS